MIAYTFTFSECTYFNCLSLKNCSISIALMIDLKKTH